MALASFNVENGFVAERVDNSFFSTLGATRQRSSRSAVWTPRFLINYEGAWRPNIPMTHADVSMGSTPRRVFFAQAIAHAKSLPRASRPNIAKSLPHKSANMDVLIVIGTSAAWLYGLILILIGYSDTIQEDTMKYKM